MVCICELVVVSVSWDQNINVFYNTDMLRKNILIKKKYQFSIHKKNELFS